MAALTSSGLVDVLPDSRGSSPPDRSVSKSKGGGSGSPPDRVRSGSDDVSDVSVVSDGFDFGGGAGGRTDFASPATARLFPSVAAAADPRAMLRMSTTSCDSLTGSILAANAAEVIQSMTAAEAAGQGGY